MQPGTVLLIVLGALLVAIGGVAALRGGKPIWWLTVVFGILMLAAATLSSIVTAL